MMYTGKLCHYRQKKINLSQAHFFSTTPYTSPRCYEDTKKKEIGFIKAFLTTQFRLDLEKETLRWEFSAS